jgi:hypothetical protein
VQNFDDVLQVANVEDGQSQLDMTEMAVAGVQSLSACLAATRLGGDAHEGIHGAMGSMLARVIRAGGEVVDIAIRDFDNGLVYDVLVRAEETLAEAFGRAVRRD